MIRDFRTYDGDGEIACDLCIAGAGAAGMALSMALRESGLRIVLLESGGLDYDEATQAMCRGGLAGLDYYDLDVARLRYLGGSTNHWGGMSAKLDEIDFAERSWVPHSGWPIGLADLDPYWQPAHEFLELGTFDWDLETAKPAEVRFLPFDPAKLVAKLYRYSTPPTPVGERYRGEVETAETLDLWLWANLVDIETDEGAQAVTGFSVRSLDGRTATVRARDYVLALGGIENPRLLLNANRFVTAGLGNQNDVVGRFFMEHPGVVSASAHGVSDWPNAYVHLFENGEQLRCAIRPSPAMQERRGVLNTMAMFGEVSRERWLSKGYTSLSSLKEAIVNLEVPDDLSGDIVNVITDIEGVVNGMRERMDPTTYITFLPEQAPNPDSRVLLGDETDALGLRRPVLDWRLQPIDRTSIRVLTELIAEELGRLGEGRIEMQDWLLEDDGVWPDELTPAFHHMGTTRMADDPKAGVVDRDCRVHGIDNLFVAGSSVFATGGCANPTLNLVALAFRLADHLRDRPS